MQVRELVEILLNMPQGDEVFINVSRASNIDHTMLQVVTNPFARRVVLQDHRTIREPKIVRAFDGLEYEIPWK